MSGDYSRKRFNPENHYQGVLRQQGRVDLDADWNEYVDLQDRHWRAETHRCRRPLRRAVGNCPTDSRSKARFQSDRRPGPHLRRRFSRRESRRQSAVQRDARRKLWHRAAAAERSALRRRSGDCAGAGAIAGVSGCLAPRSHSLAGAAVDRAGGQRRHDDALSDRVAGQNAWRTSAADVTCQTEFDRYRQMAEREFAVGCAPDHDDGGGRLPSPILA